MHCLRFYYGNVLQIILRDNGNENQKERLNESNECICLGNNL